MRIINTFTHLVFHCSPVAKSLCHAIDLVNYRAMSCSDEKTTLKEEARCPLRQADNLLSYRAQETPSCLHAIPLVPYNPFFSLLSHMLYLFHLESHIQTTKLSHPHLTPNLQE